ncbi:MAG: Gldg family protein [Bryobacterales bacterium]|nr:Gldg family protein [Bryobacterales bacterium]MBV9400339.1 Gldg family protein [Bryobacterales bacterium]
MPGQDQSRRRAATFAQAIVYTLIVIAIIGTLNFLANRYNKSYDSTANKKFTLSDQSSKIAKNLKQDLTITYWGQPSRFSEARDLLDRYKNLSPKIDVKLEDADKKRTQAIAAGVKALPTIYVQVGNKKEEAKTLTEEDITGAMVRALKGGDREVCFLSGYGEHTIDNTERDGFSKAKELAEKGNYKTQNVKMIPKAEIPMECTIAVLPGPRRDLLQPAVDAIKTYVENGGRALFMLDPPLKFGQAEVDDNTALTNVLASWGVTVQKDLVLDLSGVGQLFQLGPEFPLVTAYENHPIVRDLKDVATGFPIARSLEVKNGDKTTVEKLFATSEDSIATKNLSSPEIKQSKDDLKGPLVLAAAGTYTTGKDTGNGRFVVVGSSGFAANNFIAFNGNRDLFMNMLNWLSSDEDLISIRPKEPSDNPLNMNARQVSTLFYLSVIALPLAIVFVGAGVWWRRR